MVREGASPSKILLLAEHAQFDIKYEPAQIRETLKVFLKRFFASQYKRSCVPDGPKVGSVSLSPRGDWRMPSDADVEAWIADLQD
jgi:NAD+ synthase (glutamine-hydrolysing)